MAGGAEGPSRAPQRTLVKHPAPRPQSDKGKERKGGQGRRGATPAPHVAPRALPAACAPGSARHPPAP